MRRVVLQSHFMKNELELYPSKHTAYKMRSKMIRNKDGGAFNEAMKSFPFSQKIFDIKSWSD